MKSINIMNCSVASSCRFGVGEPGGVRSAADVGAGSSKMVSELLTVLMVDSAVAGVVAQFVDPSLKTHIIFETFWTDP